MKKIKLNSQPKWVKNLLIGVGATLGLVVALVLLPVISSNASYGDEGDGWYYGGQIMFWGQNGSSSEDDLITIVQNGTVLNIKNDPVGYLDGVNTCGEGFHVLNNEDIVWEDMDPEYFKSMLRKQQVTTQ